jgi:hypothetical protein
VRAFASATLIGAAFLDAFFVTCAITDDAMAPTVTVDTKITKHSGKVDSSNSSSDRATPAKIVARNEESHHLSARR